MAALKLFVWENVFNSYGPGTMFAYTTDLEDAKRLLIEAHMEGITELEDELGYWSSGKYIKPSDTRLAEIKSELDKPHIVYDSSPVAYIMPGSD